VIVEVEQDLTRLKPSLQTPLVDGMFVEIHSFGAKTPQLAVPDQAIHNGQVYLINAKQRLELRAVETLFSSDGWTAIKSGLKQGDRIVVNDLIPVIEGVLLAPQTASSLAPSLPSSLSARPSPSAESVPAIASEAN